MLFVAALLCFGMGAFVTLSGEEPRVKRWFFVMCLSCASVCIGLWVETRQERWAMLAARVNMTAALLAAGTGLLAVCVMCRLPVKRAILWLLGIAALANASTVGITDAYFTGGLHRYGWGIYVAGDPKFIANPLLSTVIVGYALVLLVRNLRTSHPLDRNRAKYLLVAYLFLGASVLDYLPHFGVDLFGGSVSAITMPLFVVTFGYACLRYRLLLFRDLVARASGWFITGLVMVAGYALVLEAERRWLSLGVTPAHVLAALVDLAIFIAVGARLSRWMEQRLGVAEVDFRTVVERFSDELMSILDEPALKARMVQICVETFDTLEANILGEAQIKEDPSLVELAHSGGLLESEAVRRRRGAASSHLIAQHEVLVPLVSQKHVLGVLAVGRRRDDTMYSDGALQAFRVMGNLFTMALANARRAAELQSRHRLDRYLPPQIVESVLAGQHALIEARRRMLVTIFFSDLKDFSQVADRSDPEILAAVLNEYLSEMADIAFRFGGTLDKFIGDAVMVFFGAPVPSESPEQAGRCVEMAIEMQRRLRALNASWLDRKLLTEGLAMRMGIHTGEATVGSFGSLNRVEYTAIGRAVNLASRLEGQGKPGSILVSDATWTLVKDRFHGTSRGAIDVKGLAAPVEVYEIDPSSPTFRSARFTSEQVQ